MSSGLSVPTDWILHWSPLHYYIPFYYRSLFSPDYHLLHSDIDTDIAFRTSESSFCEHRMVNPRKVNFIR